MEERSKTSEKLKTISNVSVFYLSDLSPHFLKGTKISNSNMYTAPKRLSSNAASVSNVANASLDTLGDESVNNMSDLTNGQLRNPKGTCKNNYQIRLFDLNIVNAVRTNSPVTLRRTSLKSFPCHSSLKRRNTSLV